MGHKIRNKNNILKKQRGAPSNLEKENRHVILCFSTSLTFFNNHYLDLQLHCTKFGEMGLI